MTEANDFGAIAVVGMSGRFPGAKNLDAFWDNIKNGAESITFFSDETLIEAGVDPSLLQHPHYVKAGAVLEEIDHFDAAFFGFSPREAALLDPQQRLFMECAWEAIEHAGYNLDTTDRYMGVYAGSSLSNYLLRNLLPHLTGEQAGGELASALGNDKDYLTTHLSYKLNLKGPSIGVQTACSTSLVAISLACQGLLSFQCDMALAGGVTIRVPQIAGYFYEEGSILSPDGHCRAFDARGQGPTFGSGVGVVVLKRLEDARTDGDTVHAVIRGTAINNDGAAKVGFTAPSPTGQAHVIAMAQAVAGISAETIRYVEAHGTGTPLGDPIEVAALTQAFQADTKRKGFCALGSVKTNVGHLDTAAGVAGFLKTVLALKHKMLPPSLHFETPNPEIDFANSPFYVNTQLSEWTT
ncbi:MAG: polyketide synthase, partial [Anaerolineae bacterium]|nr:polyketide synthase [Anaerolineae bacterium]